MEVDPRHRTCASSLARACRSLFLLLACSCCICWYARCSCRWSRISCQYRTECAPPSCSGDGDPPSPRDSPPGDEDPDDPPCEQGEPPEDVAHPAASCRKKTKCFKIRAPKRERRTSVEVLTSFQTSPMPGVGDREDGPDDRGDWGPPREPPSPTSPPPGTGNSSASDTGSREISCWAGRAHTQVVLSSRCHHWQAKRGTVGQRPV